MREGGGDAREQACFDGGKIQPPSFTSTRLCRLTRTTQPGLVSPGGSEQAQRYHPASLLSESAESLRHLDANHRLYREYGDAESVRGRCPRPPRYGKFLIGSLYLSLSDQEKI